MVVLTVEQVHPVLEGPLLLLQLLPGLLQLLRAHIQLPLQLCVARLQMLVLLLRVLELLLHLHFQSSELKHLLLVLVPPVFELGVLRFVIGSKGGNRLVVSLQSTVFLLSGFQLVLHRSQLLLQRVYHILVIR